MTTNLDEVLRGIIIVGGLTGSSDTTTVTAPTETPVATPAPTDAPPTHRTLWSHDPCTRNDACPGGH